MKVAGLVEHLKGIVGDENVLTSAEGLHCYCCGGTALGEAISKVSRRIQEIPGE